MSGREAVLAYAREEYGAEPENLWRKFPHYAVLRHKNEGKWFGLIMNVRRERLGLTGEGEIDVLNIKAGADLSRHMRGEPGIFPAYHMNKDQWLSLALDGSVPAATIFSLLDKSYALTGSA